MVSSNNYVIVIKHFFFGKLPRSLASFEYHLSKVHEHIAEYVNAIPCQIMTTKIVTAYDRELRMRRCKQYTRYNNPMQQFAGRRNSLTHKYTYTQSACVLVHWSIGWRMQNARTVGYIRHPPKSRGITFSFCPSAADLPKDLINYEVHYRKYSAKSFFKSCTHIC